MPLAIADEWLVHLQKVDGTVGIDLVPRELFIPSRYHRDILTSQPLLQIRPYLKWRMGLNSQGIQGNV